MHLGEGKVVTDSTGNRGPLCILWAPLQENRCLCSHCAAVVSCRVSGGTLTCIRIHHVQGDLAVLSLSGAESERVKLCAGLALTSHQSLSSLCRGLLQRGSNKHPTRVQKPGFKALHRLRCVGVRRVLFSFHLSAAWGTGTKQA